MSIFFLGNSVILKLRSQNFLDNSHHNQYHPSIYMQKYQSRIFRLNSVENRMFDFLHVNW